MVSDDKLMYHKTLVKKILNFFFNFESGNEFTVSFMIYCLPLSGTENRFKKEVRLMKENKK